MVPRMQFGPDDEQEFHSRKQQLERGFGEWVAQYHLRVDADDFGLLLDWKWGYGDGHLGRWRTGDLTEFLIGWCPRKLMVSDDDLLGSVPVAAGLGMSYLVTLDLLDPASDSVDTLVEHAVGLTEDFRSAMRDTSSFGLGKSLMTGMGVDSLEGMSQDDLQRVMDDFNALPFEERRAITDPAMGDDFDDLPEPLSFGRVRLPSQEDLRSAAATGTIIATFAALADYLAVPGKSLTKNGNLKIADAKALSELLDTGDVYEEQIGDQTFRKRSATEFVGVDFWQWWAREAGAIRVHNNKMVAVKAWRDRVRKDPLAETVRALDELVGVGPLRAFRASGTDVDDLLDVSAPALLGRLLAGGDDFEDLLANLTELGSTVGAEPLFPGHYRMALDRLLSTLEQVGVIAQDRVGYEELEDRPWRRERTGGAVTLSPLGRHLAVHAVQQAGYDVEVLPSAEEMDVDDLLDLVAEIEPSQWWDETWSWLSAADDAQQAFARLAAALAEQEPALLSLCLANLPDSRLDDTVSLVRAVAFAEAPAQPDAAAAALSWLDTQGCVGPGECTDDRLREAHLDSWIAVANADDDAASTIESIQEGATTEDQLALVQSVASRRSGAAARLLETIGHDHPERAVAKAARKEVFRLRSRLSSTG